MERLRDRHRPTFSALAHAPALAVALSLLLPACGDDGVATDSTTNPTAETAAPTGTSTTDDSTTETATDTEETSSTGLPNLCEVNAIGEWNACKKGALTDNSKCNWMASTTNGSVTCVRPSSGGGNICSIEACEDECDCYAPPATGTAPVVCAPILNDGVRGCVLDCAGDVTCPDGMECMSGYCYWPN